VICPARGKGDQHKHVVYQLSVSVRRNPSFLLFLKILFYFTLTSIYICVSVWLIAGKKKKEKKKNGALETSCIFPSAKIKFLPPIFSRLWPRQRFQLKNAKFSISYKNIYFFN